MKDKRVLRYTPVGILSLITLVGGAVLTSSTSSANSYVSTVTVDVPEACSITSSNTNVNASGEYEIEALVTPGLWVPDIATYTTSVTCNDRNGYSVYAVGYGGDTEGSTNLVGSATSEVIPTGTDMSTNSSNWMVKLTPVSGSATPTVWPDDSSALNASGYHAIPSAQTKAVTYTNSITVNTPSQFSVTYGIATASTQVADNYVGKVKYTLVHPNYADSNGDVLYMQDLTPSSISTLLPNVGDEATAYDSRDGQGYTIAKLADGKYWMTSNLNLAGGTVLSSDKSDVPSSNYYTLPASTAISSGTSVPSDQFSNDSTAYVFNTGNNTTTCNSSTPCNSYYSWLAATAGGKDSSGNTVTTNGYNAAYSICPKGWRLPTATTSNANAQTSPNWETGDWYQMIIQYMGGATSLNQGWWDDTSPNNPFLTNAGPGTTPNFLRAGSYNSGSFGNGGSSGYYWSSTAYSSTYGYNVNFNSSGVASANNFYRRHGYSVRCVFDSRTISDVTTMQDATSRIAENTPIGTTATLKDSRDDQSYTIAKLNDGKIWMTSNLNLAGGTVLSSDKSDVPSSNYYTLPTSATITNGTNVQSDQFSDNSTAYVFNTGNNTTTCDSSTPCNSYYSWLSATAGGKDASGNAVSTRGYNAAYSICPKGWRLPTATTSNASATTSPNWKTGDWYALATAYGANLESSSTDDTSATGANFYTNAGPGTTPSFLLAGRYNSGSFNQGGSRGYCWSSTASSGTIAYYIYFYSSYVDSAGSGYRRYGLSVRCVFDN